ncbi:MAG: hypothetical protein HOW73_04895 [Polyangiaceae bacterium]|nr:hypothetical protein [Polyangiaceae bacterium]
MRNSNQCPKCSGVEILYLPELTDSERDKLAAYVGPPGWTSVPHFGIVTAYVCLGCGYTELYTADPRSIPYREVPGAKILKGTPQQPYR